MPMALSNQLRYTSLIMLIVLSNVIEAYKCNNAHGIVKNGATKFLNRVYCCCFFLFLA